MKVRDIPKKAKFLSIFLSFSFLLIFILSLSNVYATTGIIGNDNVPSASIGLTVGTVYGSPFSATIPIGTSYNVTWMSVYLGSDISNYDNYSVAIVFGSNWSLCGSSGWQYLLVGNPFARFDLTFGSGILLNGTGLPETYFLCVQAGSGSEPQFCMGMTTNSEGYYYTAQSSPMWNATGNVLYYVSNSFTYCIYGVYTETTSGSGVIPISPPSSGGIDITQIPVNLASKLGISSFASGIIATIVLLLIVELPLMIFASDNIMLMTIFGILIMSVGVALTWLPYWTLILIVVMVALLFADVFRKYLTGTH